MASTDLENTHGLGEKIDWDEENKFIDKFVLFECQRDNFDFTFLRCVGFAIHNNWPEMKFVGDNGTKMLAILAYRMVRCEVPKENAIKYTRKVYEILSSDSEKHGKQFSELCEKIHDFFWSSNIWEGGYSYVPKLPLHKMKCKYEKYMNHTSLC